MNEKLKELVENAPEKRVGTFDKLMFVSGGVYDGFWGASGYDTLIVLGQEEGTWYKVSDYGDKFDIYAMDMLPTGFNLDIPTVYGVPCIWFDYPVYIDNRIPVSSVTGKLVEKERKTL